MKKENIFGRVKTFCNGVLTRTINPKGVSPVSSLNLARAMPTETKKNQNIFIRKSLNFSKIINIFGLFLILLSVFSLSVSSADPGHGASGIDAGTFASGDFIFPLNLFINQNLTIFGRNFTIGSTLFVDTILNRVGIGTTTPSNTLDVRGTGNFSGNLYVANGTLVNTWLYNQTSANESSSYAPIKWAYNQSDNSQLLFNYNQSNYSSKELQPSYSMYWINQTGSLIPLIYNQSLASFNQYGMWWNNQTSPYQSLFYNYSLVDLWNITNNNVYLKALNYTIIIGTGLFNSSDDLNLIIGNQAFRITSINASGEIYIKNGTALSIWAYNQTWNNESSMYLQLNQSTYNALTNESGSYSPIRWNYNQSNYSSQELQPPYAKYWINQTGSLIIFIYNQSLATQTEFGKFWYNQSNYSSLELHPSYSIWWRNQSADTINAYIALWTNESSSYSPIKFGYNMSDNSQLLFNYNQSNYSSQELQPVFSIFWINQTGSLQPLIYNYSLVDLWNITNNKVYPKALNYTIIIGTGLFNSSDDLNLIIGNQAFRITSINASGEIYIKNGTALSIWAYNQTWNNESGSYSPIKWAYNQSDNSQLLFNYNQSNYSSQELHPPYAKYWINQTGSLMSFIYNMTTPLISMANTWAAIQTYSSNITMSANLTFNSQNGITFNTASRYYDNGSCMLMIGRSSRIEIC